MVVLPLNKRNTLAGFQWFFFIFCNTVVVPPTLQSAFSAPSQRVNYAYPVRVYHHWIGLSGTSVTGTSSGDYGRTDGPVVEHHSDGHRGRSRTGRRSTASPPAWLSAYFFSAALTIIIGVSGIGHRLAKLFSPTVMVFFMLLLGAQAELPSFKGMLGLPFSSTQVNPGIQLAPFCPGAVGDDSGAGNDHFFSRMVSLATPY